MSATQPALRGDCPHGRNAWWRLGPLVLLCLAGACSDSGAAPAETAHDAGDAQGDVGPDPADAADVPDIADTGDDGPDTPDRPDAAADTDAADGDADVPDADPGPPALPQPVTLALDEAEVTGGTRRQECVHLHPGGTLHWTLTDQTPTATAGVDLRASSWRGEARAAVVQDTQVHLHHVWGQDRTVSLVQARPTPAAGYGVEYDPPRATFAVGPDMAFSLTAAGELDVCGVSLVPPDLALADPITPPATDDTPDTTIQLAPCGDECDDGAAISAAIAQAEGPVTVRLDAGRFRLRTPVFLRRNDVALVGAGPDTVLFFDPASARNWGAAVEIEGPRPTGATPLDNETPEGDHLLAVDTTVLSDARFAYVTAEDHGEVPMLCLGGRDVERQFRHHRFLSQVLATTPDSLALQRALPYPLPLAANPTVAAAALLEGVSVRSLAIEGACPQAAAIPEHTQRAAECDNPHLLGISAVRIRWAYRAEVRDVQARYFGRFGVDTTDSLEARVVGGLTTLPADYGGGGAGYGVHAIGASRTLVFGHTVRQARHAVVADFGSTETQIVGCEFSICTLAAIDVHGEASYDTLALGNAISRSNGSVIVGGGGREVHCNDGPRHTFIGNRLQTGGIINVQMTDYSRHVSFHHNTISDSGYSLVVSAGSADILLERNALVEARAGHILATDAVHGTDRIHVRDNHLDGDPSRWVSAEEGIGVVVEDSQ